MPQTFDDAEKLIDNQQLFNVPCLGKKSKANEGRVNLSSEMN